jgi:hypothetical protein
MTTDLSPTDPKPKPKVIFGFQKLVCAAELIELIELVIELVELEVIELVEIDEPRT